MGVAVRADCRHYSTRTLPSGDRVERCRVDANEKVPFVWNGVDGAHYLADPPAAPDEVERQWTSALEKVGDNGGLFLIICHGFITGADDERVAALDRVVGRAQDGGFELLTAGQVAERVLSS